MDQWEAEEITLTAHMNRLNTAIAAGGKEAHLSVAPIKVVTLLFRIAEMKAHMPQIKRGLKVLSHPLLQEVSKMCTMLNPPIVV